MIDTFDHGADPGALFWASASQAGNLTLVGGGAQNQGTKCLTYDKTGAAAVTAYIARYQRVGWDHRWFLDQGYSWAIDMYHATYASVANVRASYLYRWNDANGALSGNSVYDLYYWNNTAWTAGAWWTATPANSYLTSRIDTYSLYTAQYPRHVYGLHLWVQTSNSSDVPTDIGADAWRYTGKPYAVLIWDGNRVPMPPPDTWNRSSDGNVPMVRGYTAQQAQLLTRREEVDFGWRQLRTVHDPDLAEYVIEDTMHGFDQWCDANQGFGFAYPANELIDTTLNGAASVDDRTITLTDTTDLVWLGGVAEIRIGPNAARQVERAKITSYSGSTARLDRPLMYAHESGTAVRSLGYYPSLVKKGQGPALVEDGTAVRFQMQAVETA